jgi:hypothetical protein
MLLVNNVSLNDGTPVLIQKANEDCIRHEKSELRFADGQILLRPQ